MRCMPGGHRIRQSFQMHTVVTQPLTLDDVGHIYCLPMGQEPIQYEWNGPSIANLGRLEHEAPNVQPGRYRVRATDAIGDRADVSIDVQPMYERAVVVKEYRVTPATTAYSRDGSVVCVGSGMDRGIRYLWTTGIETDVPQLSDVPCGQYALIALGTSGDESTPTTIHCCPPARVGVA